MDDAVFVLDGDVATPTELARGPWGPDAAHGGAPAGLLAALIERRAEPQRLTRITIELLRPVPLAPLAAHAAGEAGRTVGRWSASLAAGGRTVARATAVSCRTAPLDVPPAAEERLPFPDAAEPLRIPGMPDVRSFYYTAMEGRLASGSVTRPGPAAVWLRLRCPLVAGAEPSGFVRAVAAADFASGTSWELPFGPYRYVNADLTVWVHRPPAGEWIGVDAATTLDATGTGVTETRLFDRDGRVGGAQQTLVVSAAEPASTRTDPRVEETS
ncbi:MAG TPA: thioesterase family protein [Solirubrobacteraceae bacterium]|nr:thioesterase family protein [Solirubrobacteraceae bacterium]